jgi:hypothetical protein
MKVNITIGIPVWLDKICAWPAMVYRKHKFGYSFRRINLGEGIYTIVDESVYYRLGHFKWSACGDDERLYAARILKKNECWRAKTICLHREIMNAPKGLLIDHKNNKTLDNRMENLRLATHSQNQYNKGKTKRKTASRYIGAFFFKDRGKWFSAISVNGKKIFLGYFDSEIDAARAYDAAAIKYHGEFARLNFPREDYNVEIRNTHNA